MKKMMLSLLVINSCYINATTHDATTLLMIQLKAFFDNDEKVTTPVNAFSMLCTLAQEADAAIFFKELHTHIHNKHPQKEISNFHDTVQKILPSKSAWNIYSAVFEAERPAQSTQKATPAQSWQKCLKVTIQEFEENKELFTSNNGIKSAIVKLVNIKVCADNAQSIQSSR